MKPPANSSIVGTRVRGEILGHAGGVQRSVRRRKQGPIYCLGYYYKVVPRQHLKEKILITTRIPRGSTVKTFAIRRLRTVWQMTKTASKVLACPIE